MSPTQTCAVTGASGYVGSILAEDLGRHFSVVPLVRHSPPAHGLQWSLESSDDIAQQLRDRDVKVLVHAAWDMHATKRSHIETTCVDGSHRLFDAALRAGVQRIVFISTISAFDGCRSVYGQTKLAVEQLLRPLPVPCVALRLGLVFGPAPGGMFGGIREQVLHSHVLPMIGSGRIPQYLLHQLTLADTVCRAARGEFDDRPFKPITLAHPRPWPFRDLVKAIAEAENRKVALLPLPPKMLYTAARSAEWLGVRLPFRSDSILSFIHSCREPDFSDLEALHIHPLPFDPTTRR